LVVVIVAVVVVVSILAGVWAYLLTRPCTAPSEIGTPRMPFSPPQCPLPPGPGPSTFIAKGTVFTLGVGGHIEFSFLFSLDTFAVLTGSFVATHPAAVYVMTPSEFATFPSSNQSKFACSSQDGCFTTGEVNRGNFSWSVPIYPQQNELTAQPWFLVMQNGNDSAATNITWVVGVEAVYVGVSAAGPTPDHVSGRASGS